MVALRVFALAVLAALFSLLGAGAAFGNGSAEGRLAAAYAPVLAIESQSHPCGGGEPYRPTSVDTVLGRADVTLRGPGGGIVKHAPRAADLFGLGEGYHLDLPGDPLRAGCGYEKRFRSWSRGRQPLVYAHVATDPTRRGTLAVEYWFFYVFNDFTDKHEGDWEEAQVDFHGSTAEEALRRGPYQVDASQHAGGQHVAWTSTALQKQGTHPVIHAATGSHANYFGDALYLGRSAGEGFGCDDTRRATHRLALRTVLLPEVPSSRAEPFAWLSFSGRWGQEERGVNNGPTGPAAHDSWTQPIAWADGLRDGSVSVPATQTLGRSVTGFFCGAVASVSVAMNWALLRPWLFLAALGAVVAIALDAARRTTWRPSDPAPLRRQRDGGQILRASRRLYRRNLGTFAAIGLVFLPISVVAAGVQWVLFHLTPLGDLVALDSRRGAVTAFMALFVGSMGAAFASLIATAAVAAALGDLDAGRSPTAKGAFDAVYRRLRPLAAAFVRQAAVLFVLTVSLLGLPFAVHRFIKWSLFAQACMLDERPGRASLRRSSELVEGHWWRTLGFTALVDVLTAASGLAVGVGLLLLTSRSLEFINVAGSLVYALAVPLAAIASTLFYLDLEARSGRGPSRDRRSPGSGSTGS